MENVIKKLKDSLGNLVYPITKTKAVYDDSNNRLDNTLSTINSDLTTAKQNIDTHTSQIAALNSSLKSTSELANYARFNIRGDSALGETGRPWLVLKRYCENNLISTTGVISGTISAGMIYSYHGCKLGVDFASFVVHGYTDSALYHVYNTSGTWKYRIISAGTGTVF